ncbi:MAG: hypothetical protein M3400_13330 [Actinomycetota bacterium]|nr:hypothetical protein [Actinomycetota bacterium]
MWFRVLDRGREKVSDTWDTLGHAFFHAAQRGAEAGLPICGLLSRHDDLWLNRLQLPMFARELEEILATPCLVDGAEGTVREVLQASRHAAAANGYLLIVGE